MPFKSSSQQKWMYANKPEMAKRWQAETPPGKLPKHVKKHMQGDAETPQEERAKSEEKDAKNKKKHPQDDKETPQEEKAANEETEPKDKKKKKTPHVRYAPKGAKRG